MTETTKLPGVSICPKCGNQYGSKFKCHHLGHPDIQQREKTDEENYAEEAYLP